MEDAAGFADDHLIPLVDEGLGNSAHLLGHDTGTTILASAAGRRAFTHRALADGDEVDLVGLTLRALATPATPTNTCPSSSTAPGSSGCPPVGR